MTRSRLSILSLIALLLTLIVPAAWASIADCILAIDTLELQVQASSFFGQNAAKDEAGLLAKLSAAEQKVGVGKFADAIAKLEEFSAKVRTLADSGKLDQADAAVLAEGAQAAIACIKSLG